MSVSPTEDVPIVVLDFEVTSVQPRRTGTFLVLLYTAISNLVLFGNNFAFSRDISGLFQSFQSSSSYQIQHLTHHSSDQQLQSLLRGDIAAHVSKRGPLESDLLAPLSTGAQEHLGAMDAAELSELDKLIDETDWNIYYWATSMKAGSSDRLGCRTWIEG
ncbi:hypothetical protein EDB89DRAFT_1094447 [Lactarius sanguifluus]|nr:hypothetical protein EDB89DRAFT_1094447 [Lactarius sanguifluus]